VARWQKTLERILRGTSDASIDLGDLCGLLEAIGFTKRVRGDHHIFTRDDVEEILNLQPKRGKAKPYQVRQVRALILRYKLGADDGD
jgi:predicted RNA binding protein YcfA (HicA-like mRNA interferase family)